MVFLAIGAYAIASKLLLAPEEEKNERVRKRVYDKTARLKQQIKFLKSEKKLLLRARDMAQRQLAGMRKTVSGHEMKNRKLKIEFHNLLTRIENEIKNVNKEIKKSEGASQDK